MWRLQWLTLIIDRGRTKIGKAHVILTILDVAVLAYHKSRTNLLSIEEKLRLSRKTRKSNMVRQLWAFGVQARQEPR